jgi:hypothetical protein
VSNIFDTNSGAINVLPKLTFRAGMTLRDVEQKGVEFVREIDMKTGWVFRTTGPYDISGHATHLSLGFENDLLKRVGFSFASKSDADIKIVRQEHDRFLLEELGEPSGKNDHQTIYRFAWGEIASEIDPRGGFSQILVSWI